MISELATPAPRLQRARARTSPIFGLCVHTTGSGIVEQARKLGRDPFEHAIDYYTRPDSYFAQYVIGWDGAIVGICDEAQVAPHVGFAERPLYLSGEWARLLPAELVALWRAAWPAHQSPAHLFPGASPNGVYVGAELLPLEEYSSRWQPAFQGARFTLAQHQAIVMLGADVARRAAFPAAWQLSSRLCGHEDLNPLTRSTRKPPAGWDPGTLRAAPWFDLLWVRRMLSGEAAVPRF